MVTVEKTIREVTNDALDYNIEIIRRAFGTVAIELGLTVENCPVYPAFTTVERLEELRTRGAVFFGLFVDSRQVGFVAVEKERDGMFYMKRLAVLPEYRHEGFGRELVMFIVDFVRKRGINKMAIAIVNEQTVLKDWYKGMGFKEISVKEFERLPFKVCFMELEVS